MARLGGWLVDRRVTRVALMAGLFPLGLLSILSAGVAVFDATALGWRTATIDCLIALGILVVVILLSGGASSQIAVGAGATWVIAIAAGSLTGAYGSLTLPIQVLVVLGVLGVLGFYVWVADAVVFWEDYLTRFAGELEKLGFQVADPRMLHPLATVMTGMTAASVVIGAILALLLGVWWASGAGGPAFRPMFLSLRMGHVIGGLTALAGIGALVGAPPLSGNVLLVLATGLALQGLAVVHWHVSIRRLAWPWLLGVYLPLFMGPSIALSAMFLLTALGFLDNWYGLRRNGRDMV